MLSSGRSFIPNSAHGCSTALRLLSKISTVGSVRALHDTSSHVSKSPLVKSVASLVTGASIAGAVLGRRSYSQLLNGRVQGLRPAGINAHGYWNPTISKRWFFSGPNINKLTEDADAHPNDMEKQAALFKALYKAGKATAIIHRFESKAYANNGETAKMYLQALEQMGMHEEVSKYLLQRNAEPSTTTAAAGVGASTVATEGTTEGATAHEGANASASEAGTGAGAGAGHTHQTVIPPIVTLGQPGKPILVKIAREWWSWILPMAYPFYWLAIIYIVVKYLVSTDKDGSISLFDVPTHHDRAEVIETRFKDVKGCDESKAELEEVVSYLKEPKKFTDIGAALPKGVLLVGEPGTGKTLLARAIAGEANVPFFYCSGSAFDEIFVGVGSKRVRSLFADAKKHAPCIIFIDEIDAIGGKRNKWQTASQDGTLQQLLTELDGFEKNEGVIIIAATNMPDSLDPALVRPGRFDKQVVVPVPDVKGRKEIVDLYLSKIKVDGDVDSQKIARATPGFTGADINQLINLAAIKAVTQGKSTVSLSIIEETRDDIWMGRMRKTAVYDEKTRKMTAYHEGGHALVSLLTDGSDPVHKATIIQRGQALGVVTHLPEGDQLSLSRKQMMAKIAVAMAGRAAEEVVYGEQEVTSGASSDFNQATKMAYNMVTKWGMSDKVGFVYTVPQERKPSPDTMKVIDGEVKGLLEKQYEYARNILITHRKELDTLAHALLDRETMTGEEIAQLLKIDTLRKALQLGTLPLSSASLTSPTSTAPRITLGADIPPLQQHHNTSTNNNINNIFTTIPTNTNTNTNTNINNNAISSL